MRLLKHFKIHIVNVLCNFFLQVSGEAKEPKGKTKRPLAAKTAYAIFLKSSTDDYEKTHQKEVSNWSEFTKEAAENWKVRAKECQVPLEKLHCVSIMCNIASESCQICICLLTLTIVFNVGNFPVHINDDALYDNRKTIHKFA